MTRPFIPPRQLQRLQPGIALDDGRDLPLPGFIRRRQRPLTLAILFSGPGLCVAVFAFQLLRLS